jgi:adenosylmethionine-8-amino-7-oxononanoate aminotransferase
VSVTAQPENLLLHFTANGTYVGPDAKDLLVLERGEGCHVFDTAGRRYVDGLSSLFCSQIGYSYGEEMTEAIAGQLAILPFNTNWGTAHPAALELSRQLVERAPAGIASAFFTSGGSESVEAAWKIVRQHHLVNGEPGRTKVIARDIAYHGVTLGALSFTGVPRFKEPFGKPAIETRHVSSTNAFRSPVQGEDLTRKLLAELDEAIQEEGPEQVAMVIAEPIQNAGGCFTPPPGYWQGLREVCDRYGIVLAADEVIAGCGRLGEWFGSEHYGARPDVITIAKGLTSAYAPMGAVLVSETLTESMRRPGVALLHGITFGGHPVAAAAALRNIEIFERDGVLENVRARRDHLRARLEEEVRPLPIVGDVRGDGFFFAAEMTPDGGEGRFDEQTVGRLVREIVPPLLLEHGLIARGDDRGDPVLQIAPPLIADEIVLEEIVIAMRDVLAAAGDAIGLTAAVGS